MRANTSWLLGLILVAIGTSAGALAQDGVLTRETVRVLHDEFPDDVHTRAIRNALTSADIKGIAESRAVLASHDAKFSHKIKTKGISNQKSSGRCWMFAGFNTIKPVLMNKLDISDFEFSQIYLQFWDKLEKANLFLEYMIEYRDRDLMDRDVVFLLRNPAADGGYWENFADLVAKYGVIPKEAMAETASSENTRMMNQALFRLLRTHAVRLRQIHEETGSVDKMRQAKKEMLAEVYRVLVLNLGEPPTEFTWRYRLKDKKDKEDDQGEGEKQDEKESVTEDEAVREEAERGEDSETEEDAADYEVEQKWSERRTFTPKSFYDEFVGLDLGDYVKVSDDPLRPKRTHVEIDLTRCMVGGANMHYANATIGELKQAVIKSILDNKAVYFAADVSPDQDSKRGIMARGLYDYESLYDLNMGLDRTERILYRDSTINHGMAFIGVDLVDGNPVKWLVENSWGSDRGSKGLWTMYDEWFEDNVYNVIVHREYVPEGLLKVLEQPARKFPVWDPMW